MTEIMKQIQGPRGLSLYIVWDKNTSIWLEAALWNRTTLSRVEQRVELYILVAIKTI